VDTLSVTTKLQNVNEIIIENHPALVERRFHSISFHWDGCIKMLILGEDLHLDVNMGEDLHLECSFVFMESSQGLY
jgi:hypothetical protein